MGKSIVVFAPHPDDETLACGGTIVKRLREGYDVTVVVMTDGRHALSSQGILSDPTPEELKEIRRLEAIKAMNILGVNTSNLIFWDFEDKALSENKEAAGNKSVEILNAIQPTEIYCSSENSAHPDHKSSSVIVKESIKRLTFPVPCFQYPLLPKFLHLGYYSMLIQNLYRHNLLFVDVSEFISQKAAAIDEYASQKTIISMSVRSDKCEYKQNN